MPTSATLKRQALRFQSVRGGFDLAALLKEEQSHLALMARQPFYKVYRVPKKDGSHRLIEDPDKPLKTALRKLNACYMATYHPKRPTSVHGFCLSASNEDDRNIISNAASHLGNSYMLNMDLEDFFHSVSLGRVEKIHQEHFPNLANDTISLLCGLTTYRGRLPMGSPTSPILSNFACLGLDSALGEFGSYGNITYTRYADDLTFSSSVPITPEDEQIIRDTITHHDFVINEEKVKRSGAGEPKSITGLKVTETEVTLPENYLPLLADEIARLKTVMAVEGRYRTGMSHRKLELFKQELTGKINFASMVLGDTHEKVIGIQEKYEEAIDPDTGFESTDWLEIPYTF